jgi:hypothetical protein
VWLLWWRNKRFAGPTHTEIEHGALFVPTPQERERVADILISRLSVFFSFNWDKTRRNRKKKKKKKKFFFVFGPFLFQVKGLVVG